jgi:hypothetical protein
LCRGILIAALIFDVGPAARGLGGFGIERLEADPKGLEQGPEGQPFPEHEELRDLIAQGRERGYLTFEQIASTLEEVEVTKEQVSALHNHLVEHGVDVIAQDGVSAYKEQRAADANGQPTKKTELDLTVEPSLDSLRLYLRSIGRVDLLTADQEISLAKRIERGDMQAKWRRTCASSCRSRRGTWGGACHSST